MTRHSFKDLVCLSGTASSNPCFGRVGWPKVVIDLTIEIMRHRRATPFLTAAPNIVTNLNVFSMFQYSPAICRAPSPIYHREVSSGASSIRLTESASSITEGFPRKAFSYLYVSAVSPSLIVQPSLHSSVFRRRLSVT